MIEDGMHWTEPVKVISANKSEGALGNHSIYRASLVKTNKGYRVYYGAMSNRKEWHIYLSRGNIAQLTGYSITDQKEDES